MPSQHGNSYAGQITITDGLGQTWNDTILMIYDESVANTEEGELKAED